MSDNNSQKKTILFREGKIGGYDGNAEEMVMVIKRMIREIG
jgi:hypothetical protein